MDEPRPPARRVFLSHTSELAKHPAGRSFVDAAASAVTRAGDAVVEMTTFAASHLPPAEECRELVGSSDVLVVLAGFHYGSVPPGPGDRSYVEIEYDAAGGAGLPRLALLLDDEAQGPGTLFLDPVGGPRQLAFREQLRHAGITAAFRTPDELELQLHQALTHLGHTGTERPRSSARWQRVEVHDSQGVQIGDHNVQSNTFGMRP